MLNVICQCVVHVYAEHRTGKLCRQDPAHVEHAVTTSKVCSMVRLLHSCDVSLFGYFWTIFKPIHSNFQLQGT